MTARERPRFRALRLAAAWLSLASIVACGGNDEPAPPQAQPASPQPAPPRTVINVNSTSEAADGLDLQAVGELVKEVDSAEEFERRLNEENGVNNLDLNEDGQVDFISVTEYGEGDTRGFSLTVQPVEGETQEIATIEVTQEEASAQAEAPAQQPAQGQQAAHGGGGGRANVYVSGSPVIYGPGVHYHVVHPISPTWLLLGYLFAPHPFYVSPFHFGYYPPYFGGGFGVVSRSTYVSRTRTVTRNSSATRVPNRQSRLRSPNAGAVANRGIRASLRNPTQSQRSFQARNPSRRTGAGGFGRSNRSSTARSTTTNRSTTRSTSRGSGFGRNTTRSSSGSRSYGSRSSSTTRSSSGGSRSYGGSRGGFGRSRR